MWYVHAWEFEICLIVLLLHVGCDWCSRQVFQACYNLGGSFLSRLYNKESVLEFLIDRSKFECAASFDHLRGLKVWQLLHLSLRGKQVKKRAEEICSFSGLREKMGRGKMNKLYFTILWWRRLGGMCVCVFVCVCVCVCVFVCVCVCVCVCVWQGLGGGGDFFST